MKKRKMLEMLMSQILFYVTIRREFHLNSHTYKKRIKPFYIFDKIFQIFEVLLMLEFEKHQKISKP